MSRFSRETGTTRLFYATWKAPVAVLDRMPEGGGAARRALQAAHTPDGREAVGIGQEALVLKGREGLVEKYFPTEQEYIDKRLFSLFFGSRAIAKSFGRLAAATMTDVAEAPSPWLRRLGSQQMPMQIQKDYSSHHGSVFELEPGSELLEQPSLKEDIGKFITGMHVALECGEYVPDIQGRGDNLVVVEGNEGERLKLLDMSAFRRDGELRNFDADKEENTKAALGRLEDLV